MKNNFTLFNLPLLWRGLGGGLLLLALVLFAGCEKEKDEAPAVPPLEVSPATVAATAAAGTYPIAVTSDTTWTATVNPGAAWCTLTDASGSGNGTVTVNVAKNTTTETRAATVTFTAGTLTTAVPVTQAAATGTSGTGTPSTAQITMTVEPDESRELKFYASAQQLVVDWGDGQTGTFTNVTSSAVSHTYATRSTYTVRISETGLTKFGDYTPCEEFAFEECDPTAFIEGDIKQLYIDGCASLKGVIVIGDIPDEEYRGALTDLEINNCPALQVLDCRDNQLASLDVSSLTALQFLSCDDNLLTAQALNTIFTALPDRTGGENGYASVWENPGSEDCDYSIAENKNWYISERTVEPEPEPEPEPATPPYAASTQTWVVGSGADLQVWSDVINHTDLCNKEAFNGGTELAPVADCRRNAAGYKGYYYSWPFVNVYGASLCPDPWRVPSKDDFIKLLHLINGSLAPNETACYDCADAIAGLPELWGYENAGRVASNTPPTTAMEAYYWSAVSITEGSSFGLKIAANTGHIIPDKYAKRYGMPVRCVQ